MFRKKLIKFRFLILLLCTSIYFISCGKKPDVIYTNGKFYTLDPNNTIVEAVAVYDGRILETGSTNELTEKYSSSKTIDLKGQTVVPGFIDAEGNLMEFSKQLSLVDLRNASSIPEIVSLIGEKVKSSKEGEWIGGFGWDELKLSDNDLKSLNNKILDNISTNHYIYIVNALGNATLVNTKVLQAANIHKDTPDPIDGAIGFSDNGEPNGFFFDAAQELVMKVMPAPTEEQIMKNVENGMKELLKYGVTEINDANISEDVMKVYKKLADQNKFPIRLYAMINGKSSMFETYLSSGPESYKDKIAVNCIYIEHDGYFETQDAVMADDYLNEPKRKIPYCDEFDMIDISKKAFQKNFQISIKVVGDRGVNSALNAIETASKELNKKPERIRFEYLEFVSPGDMQRLKQLDIIPSIRPEVTLFDKYIVSEIIKSENSKNLGLWNSLYSLNKIIISGTDFPYHTINPLIQMYYLVTGLSLDTGINKTVNNSSQKLTTLEALKSFTLWAAYASYSDEDKGSFEEGKLADMVVLSENIMESDSRSLLNAKVILTIISGEIVYENKQTASY